MICSKTQALYESGYFTAIDFYFAKFILQTANTKDQDIELAAALVSKTTRQGGVCLDLNNPSESDQDIDIPNPVQWAAKLKKCRVVGIPRTFYPLIIDEKQRLYLYRYWDYENKLACIIKAKAKHNKNLIKTSKNIFNLQEYAAAVSSLKNICIITGGPGTGKTSAVVNILALLLQQAEKKLKIFLTTPTGKAAARLGEAVKSGKKNINCPDSIKQIIPDETFTIHRLLRPIHGTPYFYFNSKNRIPADIVIVDESSMVDLALMSKLVQALPDNAKLILLGDKDQLSSVESGYVLGDICSGIYQKNNNDLSQCIVNLKIQHRFSQHSGILKISRSVNSGDCAKTLQIISDPKNNDIILKQFETESQIYQYLSQVIKNKYAPLGQVDDPQTALQYFDKFKILCAVRKGSYGVEAVNTLAQNVLQQKKYRPILITENNYYLGLFNGDMGIETENFVYFPDNKSFPSHILPQYETAYAMTVHKSQGSEFDQICLILPDSDSPILTKELLYTAITRARRQVIIIAKQNILELSIKKKISRSSGLKDALWEMAKHCQLSVFD